MPLLSEIIFKRHDKDGSGSIDAKELREIAYSLGHPMTQAQGDSWITVRHADGPLMLYHGEPTRFTLNAREIDLDESGELSYAEFKQWWAQKDRFSKLGEEEKQEEANADANEDAAKQWTEWLDRTVQHFAYFDKDHSGSISRDEFGALYDNLKSNNYRVGTMDQALNDLDANNDGVVSLREYVAWLRRQ